MKKVFKNLLISILMIQMIVLFNMPKLNAFYDELDNIELVPDTNRTIVENIEIENYEEETEAQNNEWSETFVAKKYYSAGNSISDYIEDERQIINKADKSDIFINKNGRNYTYTYNKECNPNIVINRYCFETKEYTEVYNTTSTTKINYMCAYYVKNNTIYFALYINGNTNELYIIGYNVESEGLSYGKKLSISKDKFLNSFCIDDKGNLYIVQKGNNSNEYILNSYNNQLISSCKYTYPEECKEIQLLITNSKYLFAKIKESDGTYAWFDDCVIKQNNGVLDNNFYIIRRKAGMQLVFLDNEKTLTYNQYGEIIQFAYTNENQLGMKMLLRDKLDIGTGKYFNIKYLYTSDDKYIYLGGADGYLVVYNWKTYNIEKKVNIGPEKTIVGVYRNNDKLFLEYTQDGKVYAVIINYNKFTSSQSTIEIRTHTTLNRSKEEIKNKYNEYSIVDKYNYNDVYIEKPSITAPYKSGSLKEQTKKDTLNQINYFRYLAGVDLVTRNDNYMEYAQCGAVLLAASDKFMHKPPKPADMSEEFYKKAIGGTNAEIGVSMSADISRGISLPESLQGYIDDIRNIEPDVGHRLSLLDPRATLTSFGYANKNGNIDMFITWNKQCKDVYYAWPSAGEFPIESINKDAMWSISYDASKYYCTDNTYIVIKANGKEYSSKNNDFTLMFDSSYRAYYYNIPDEVKKYLTDDKYKIQEGKSVEVEVYGLQDNLGNSYIIKYPVRFFSIQNTEEKIYKKGDINGDGKVTAKDLNILYAHIMGNLKITGEELERAKIAGNNNITAKDLNMLYAIIKQEN